MPLPVISQTKQEEHPLERIQAVLAIAAGKGGVGKSTVAVNLALALQARGYRVGIMDTDLYGPSIRKMLPEERVPSQTGEIIQPALCKGIKMISMAYFRREEEAAAVRAPIANAVISQFIKNVQWGELDFLIVDFPPGTGDIQLTLSQQAHLLGAIMVTTPQEVALQDVRKAISLFDQVKVPLLGIVENMSYFQPDDQVEPVYIFGKGGGERLASESSLPLLGKIPLDPFLCSCADRGESLFAQDPTAKRLATRAFVELTKQVIAQAQALLAEKRDGVGSFELLWRVM